MKRKYKRMVITVTVQDRIRRELPIFEFGGEVTLVRLALTGTFPWNIHSSMKIFTGILFTEFHENIHRYIFHETLLRASGARKLDLHAIAKNFPLLRTKSS